MEITATSDDYKNPIEVIPLSQYFNEKGEDVLGQHREFKEKKIVVSEDHERLYSVVSNKTPIIHHHDAIEVVHDAIEKIYDMPPVVDLTSMHTGASIMANFKLPVPETVRFAEGDESTISIILFNSYERKFPFKLKTGLYRMVCSNGMLVGDEIASLNARQMIADGFSKDNLSPNIERLITRTKSIEQFWQKWKDIEIPADVAIQLIEKNLSKKLYKDLIDEARFPMKLWEFYNEITRISTHETSTFYSNVVSDLSISKMFYSSKSILRELDEMTDDVLIMKAANTEELPALANDEQLAA